MSKNIVVFGGTFNPPGLHHRLIAEALAKQFDEVIVVRSERAVAADPAFAERVRSLVADVRAGGGVTEISSYLDPGGEALVSRDRHATLLPVVVADPEDERIADVIASSAGIDTTALDSSPFTENGGTDGALRDLGDRAATLIHELNTELTA